MTTSTRCGGTHDRPAWATVGLLCRPCRDRLHRDLIRLPALVDWLTVNLAPGRGVTEKISGSRELPVPVRLDVLDLIGPAAQVSGSDQIGLPSIHVTLNTWAAIVAVQRPAPLPTGTDVGTVAPWLAVQLGWLITAPWVVELASDVARLHHYVRLVAPWEAERRLLDSPCPACDVKALVFHGGVNTITCQRTLGGCGHEMDDHDYKRLVTETLATGRAS